MTFGSVKLLDKFGKAVYDDVLESVVFLHISEDISK
jgi:hypothetical protein